MELETDHGNNNSHYNRQSINNNNNYYLNDNNQPGDGFHGKSHDEEVIVFDIDHLE